MKTYRVVISEETSYERLFEAKNQDQAEKLAELDFRKNGRDHWRETNKDFNICDSWEE